MINKYLVEAIIYLKDSLYYDEPKSNQIELFIEGGKKSRSVLGVGTKMLGKEATQWKLNYLSLKGRAMPIDKFINSAIICMIVPRKPKQVNLTDYFKQSELSSTQRKPRIKEKQGWPKKGLLQGEPMDQEKRLTGLLGRRKRIFKLQNTMINTQVKLYNDARREKNRNS